ncbi:MAG: FAD-binding oxidoreductase [Actinomycetota bacterium]|nr:FAD-binding oxidoreductase [Actinomycetota bacterium]
MTQELSRQEGEELLTGWGRTVPSLAQVVKCSSTEEVQAAVLGAGPRGVLVRGLGRSYGDAAQSGGAKVLDLQAMNGIQYDSDAGLATAGAGASLDSIMRALVPQGAFVPVTPGTRMITIGGAISTDVHGKNHHVDGTFGAHVRQLTLVDGNGELRELNPDDSTGSQFWTTVGGMGLTGAITSASFDVIPVETSRICVDTERAKDLDEVMAHMVAGDSKYRYTVAWIDTVSASGRGVITSGDHARLDQLSVKQRATALEFDPKALASVPNIVPPGLLNKLTVRAFNEAWYRKAPGHRTGEIQSIGAFFHPLDGVQNWNRVYGPGGFLQYQFVVPDSASQLVRVALDRLRSISAPSFLTVLKRFGEANPAPLSFPQAGWTLAADVPAGVPGLGAVLDELDERVADAGGRLYLAKDSRQSPQMFARTYPRLGEWQKTRDELDPRGIFTSDLARRLSI